MYSVTFHEGSRRTVHTFWFNSKEKAARFFDSLINNPKIKDAELLSIPVCDADAYNESVQEEYITTIKGF